MPALVMVGVGIARESVAALSTWFPLWLSLSMLTRQDWALVLPFTLLGSSD